MAKTQSHQRLPSIIGQNVRYLRRKAGLTIPELAEAIGIQPNPLGNIERGVNAPSARVVVSLADVLGVSTDTLFAKSEQKRREAYERSKILPFPVLPESRSIPAAALTMAENLCTACLDLEDICGAQKHANIPIRLHITPDEGGMAELVVAVRQFMNIHAGIVFDYFELFETCGFRVLLLKLPKKADSFSFFDPANENAFFFISAKMNGERQLFLLAYELGLIFLRSAQNGKWAVSPQELSSLAKKFAAFFLMPAESVLKTVAQLGVSNDAWTYELLLRIKHRFGVSAESFLYRLRELEKIEEELYRKIKGLIYSHYERNNYAEPDSTRRIMTPNARLWDLVQVAKGKVPDNPEIKAINRQLENMHIPAQPNCPKVKATHKKY